MRCLLYQAMSTKPGVCQSCTAFHGCGMCHAQHSAHWYRQINGGLSCRSVTVQTIWSCSFVWTQWFVTQKAPSPQHQNYFTSSDPHHDISKQLVDTTFVWSFCHGTLAQPTIPIICFTWQVIVHISLSNTGILSGILSGILIWHSYLAFLSGLLSGTLSDVLSGILIWHSYLAFLSGILLWHSSLAFYLAFHLAFLAGILIWHSSLAFYLALYLTFDLAFYLAYLLAFSPAVEVRQGTLGVDSHGWGQAGNTGRGWSWLRSGRGHLAWILAVEVRQGTLGVDSRGWGPAGNTWRGWSWLRSGGGGRRRKAVEGGGSQLT